MTGQVTRREFSAFAGHFGFLIKSLPKPRHRFSSVRFPPQRHRLHTLALIDG